MNDRPASTPQIDAEFKALCPPLSRDEAQLLEQSIEHEGCRDALVVWNGVLLDGHNRLTFCRAHKLDFETIELEGVDTRDQARNWIINNQLGRRNVTSEQASYLRGKRYNAEKKVVGRPEQLGQNDPINTHERLAEEYKVSPRTIKRDAKFAEAVDKIADTVGDDARDKILSRDSLITKAGIVLLAEVEDVQTKEDIITLSSSTERESRSKARERLDVETQPRNPKHKNTPEQEAKRQAFLLSAEFGGHIHDFERILGEPPEKVAAAVAEVSIPRTVQEVRRVTSWLQRALTALEKRHASRAA